MERHTLDRLLASLIWSLGPEEEDVGETVDRPTGNVIHRRPS